MGKILCGDWIEQLKTLPDQSIQCCVTSPPYWGLRDYGTATWEGGNPQCNHEDAIIKGRADYGFSEKCYVQTSNISSGYTRYKQECPKCGAERVDAQLGLEKTPEEYVTKLVLGFREVWRVLRDDGVMFLNLGDSYANTKVGNTEVNKNPRVVTNNFKKELPPNLKPKDLVGIPWRVAFALQADGWYLRSDIIWDKPNPMPESVTDRPTKSHEYIFLLTKSERYFYDAEAIKEGSLKFQKEGPRPRLKPNGTGFDDTKAAHVRNDCQVTSSRNKRSVWRITTKPYSDWSNDFFSADYVGVDGNPYKASQDCPIHGVLVYLRSERKELYDELLNLLSRRNLDSDNHPDLKSFSVFVSNSFRSNDTKISPSSRKRKIGSKDENKKTISLTAFYNQENASGKDVRTSHNSDLNVPLDGKTDCSLPDNSLTAIEHNNQNHKTAPVLDSTPPYISFDRTLYDTLHIEEALVKIGWVAHNYESNILAGFFLGVFYLSVQTEPHIAGKHTYNKGCRCKINTLSHFATFPPELPRLCIKAGTSERGCCPQCGTPWKRIVSRTQYTPEVVEPGVRRVDESRGDKVRKLSGKEYNKQVKSTTTGWEPGCECGTEELYKQEGGKIDFSNVRETPQGTHKKKGGQYQKFLDAHPNQTVGWEKGCEHGLTPVPCVVLDPFGGAGTTAFVAHELGRDFVIIELNPEYIKLIEKRVKPRQNTLLGYL